MKSTEAEQIHAGLCVEVQSFIWVPNSLPAIWRVLVSSSLPTGELLNREQSSSPHFHHVEASNIEYQELSNPTRKAVEKKKRPYTPSKCTASLSSPPVLFPRLSGY